MKRIIMAVGALILAALALLAPPPAAANNLVVTNVALVSQDVVGRTVRVKCDLSWENSWRSDYPSCTNWDAAWVFVKFRAPGSNAWEHAKLSAVAADHAAPGGAVAVGSDGTNGIGVFVYSASVRTGDVSYAGTRLQWNYGSNGYSFAKGTVIEVSVQAIEMVYVPEGSFYVGSGGTESYSFTDGSWGGSGPSIPFQITGTWDRQIANAAGKLWGVSSYGNCTIGAVGTLNESFPSGYNAFYCMKYEITQGQYRDFLNLLTRAQQNTRTASQSLDYFAMSGSASLLDRNGIRCPSVIADASTNIVFGCDGNANKIFNETNDGMDWACNYLLWADVCAYADWAGLRPMTELEFEKACRGPAMPVANEYAWGTAALVQLTNYFGTDGSGTETALPTNANYNGWTGGPVRAGLYATTNSTRVSSGASYWGIMQMSGNVIERPVPVGISRAFTGLHGDGNLTTAGDANVANWPDAGRWVHAGNWSYAFAGPRVSDRCGTIVREIQRAYGYGGGRAVRTAP